MIVISSTKLTKSLDGRAGAGLPSIIQRWPGRNSHEILPGLFLNWVIAGAAFAIRQLPGMAMFNPMMLSMAIGIAFHNIVGTAAWAKQGGGDAPAPKASPNDWSVKTRLYRSCGMRSNWTATTAC